MKDELETNIQNALQGAPGGREPSDDLVRRLRVLARETSPRPQWRRARFSAPFAFAATAAAVFVATALIPTRASAKSFGMIVAAAQRINAFQFSVVVDENAKREAFTIAGSDGHAVMRTGESTVMEVDAQSMSLYDPKTNVVTRFKYGNLAATATLSKEIRSGLAEGLKEIDLKKILREYAEKYGQNGIRISPVTRQDGRSVYHVTLATPNQPERVEMTVDAESDLPERLHVESRDGEGNWHDSVVMEMRFGDRVDASLLRSSIPKDAKVETIDLGSMVGDALKGLENLGDSLSSGAAKPK